MRILLISRCPLWPLYLGDRLIVYHLVEEMEARKHELDLLAFTNRPDDWHRNKGNTIICSIEVQIIPRPTTQPNKLPQTLATARFALPHTRRAIMVARNVARD